MPEQPPNYPPPDYPPPTSGGYGGYGYPPPVYAAPRTNALAIASLVASLAGLVTCGLGDVLGLVFGLVGVGQIRRTGERGRGLAIAGIVISTVILVLLVVAFVVGTKNKHDREEDMYSSERTVQVISAEELPAAAHLALHM